MNNINGINSYGGPKVVRTNENRNPHPARPASEPAQKPDRVEISQIAQLMSKIAALPEMRTEKVEQVRQALAEGRYDLEDKLPIALDRFLEENFDL